MTPLLASLSVLLAAALGLAAGRRWGRQEGARAAAGPLEERLREAQTRAALAEQDAQHQKDAGGAAALEAEGLREELRAQRLEAKGDADAHALALSAAKSAIAGLETAIAKDRDAAAVERRHFDEAQARAQQTFENLANRIFEGKSLAFDAKSRELLEPFRGQLETFRKRVDDVHTESVKGQSALKSELESLRRLNQQVTEEASNLARALKGDKKMQGSWGEQKLELLLERSGLRKGEEYEAQHTLKDLDGQSLRPDFVVRLPEGKHIIIDSKVSLVAYSDYMAAEDQEAREGHLKRHVEAVRKHIATLGDKRYHNLAGLESPEMVLMFMPIEPAYLAAVEKDPDLLQESHEKRVALVTATTLLPVLRVAASLWGLQRQNRSAQELAMEAGRIVDKVSAFITTMLKLGERLDRVRDTYGESMNALRDGPRSLVVTAKKFQALGARATKRLPLDELEGAAEEPEEPRSGA
jgi:DNA recombination protein RmuC